MGTPSGRHFWPLDPQPEDICLEDIGWCLSQQCRYNGGVPPPNFYSVAEHLVIMSEYFEGFAQQNIIAANAIDFDYYMNLSKWAFVHDWEEAYTGDMVRPIKHLFPFFIEIGDSIQKAIFKKFGMIGEIPKEVHEADTIICNDERIQLWPYEIAIRENWFSLPRLHVQIKAWEPKQAYREFMARAHKLNFMVYNV